MAAASAPQPTHYVEYYNATRETFGHEQETPNPFTPRLKVRATPPKDGLSFWQGHSDLFGQRSFGWHHGSSDSIYRAILANDFRSLEPCLMKIKELRTQKEKNQTLPFWDTALLKEPRYYFQELQASLTPFQFAVYLGRSELVALFLDTQYCGDLNQPFKIAPDGTLQISCSALELATLNRDLRMMNLLLHADAGPMNATQEKVYQRLATAKRAQLKSKPVEKHAHTVAPPAAAHPTDSQKPPKSHQCVLQ